MRSRPLAFTLVELLVVIAIIGVLVALLLPAVQAARESARRTQCVNNLKQLAIATHNFHDNYQRFPQNGSKFSQGSGTCCTEFSWSWIARTLPFFEQNPLFLEAGIDDKSMTNNPSIAKSIKTLFCPSDVSMLASNTPSKTRSDMQIWGQGPEGLSNYKGVTGANWCWGNWPNVGTNGNCDCFYQNGTGLGDGIFFRTDILFKQRMPEITDGLSNTLMIGEDVPEYSAWCGWAYSNHAVGTCAIPPNVNLDKKFGVAPTWNWENTYSFRSRHPGGLQFALADGSVRFMRATIDLAIYRGASTTQGGERVNLD
jgi:prepilin-type N-terminal cleavage/methylation domain-containing protein/prepilin-type processing-associated H-X9-DG protein